MYIVLYMSTMRCLGAGPYPVQTRRRSFSLCVACTAMSSPMVRLATTSLSGSFHYIATATAKQVDLPKHPQQKVRAQSPLLTANVNMEKAAI